MTLTQVYMQQAALFVASDEDIQNLFLTGKKAVEAEGGGAGGQEAAQARDSLYKEIEPFWENMLEEYGLRQIHFHLGPGSTSFLRAHRPNKFGDNMDEVRYTIVDANLYQAPTAGFETGRVYSGIRGVVPVFAIDPETDKKVHVGPVEVGISFKKILESLEGVHNVDMAVLLTLDHLQSNMWADFLDERFAETPPIGDFAIETVSQEDNLREILATEAGYVLLLDTGTEIIKLSSGKSYGITSFNLRDYRGTVDPSLPRAGVIYIWEDISEEVLTLQEGIRNNIIFSLLAYVLFEIIFFWAIKILTQYLQEVVDEQTKTIQVLASHDPLTKLYNRHTLKDRFEEEIERSKRQNKPFAVTML
ncbi:MAG: diguanylate cyclase, partial [Anaerolineae bacterium]|nr:diguanylate cyclase [Anaerolineae bacterium]